MRRARTTKLMVAILKVIPPGEVTNAADVARDVQEQHPEWVEQGVSHKFWYDVVRYALSCLVFDKALKKKGSIYSRPR